MTITSITRNFGRRGPTMVAGGCGWDEQGTIENLRAVDDTPLSHLSGCVGGDCESSPSTLGLAGSAAPVVVESSGVGMTVYSILATASMAASAYHGYKRNDDLGYGLWWGLMGALFPVITPVIAVAQGFGQPIKRSANPVSRPKGKKRKGSKRVRRV